MPDWITHISATWIGLKLAKRTHYFTSLALVGSILPDAIKVVLRPAELIFGFELVDYKMVFLLAPLHSLIGAALLALSISFFLAKKANEVKMIFLGLYVGILLHFLLDSLSFYGITPLVPLSWERLALELFWPDSLLPALLVVATAIGIKSLEVTKALIRKGKV